MRKQPILAVLLVAVSAAFSLGGEKKEPRIIDVRKIWDAGQHNAFTDLIRFQDQWYCTFRESTGHVGRLGDIRILRSKDGEKWESAALIKGEDTDLRDPKLSIDPQGRLMLLAPKSWHQKEDPVARQPAVWFSKNGTDWSKPVEVGQPNWWLWRVTWHDDFCLGVGYQVRGGRQTRLYKSTDGVKFDVLVDTLYTAGEPNESTVRLDDDGKAMILSRREKDPHTAIWGTAQPPYTDWKWIELDRRIGGPNFIRLPDGRIVVAGRHYVPQAHSTLCWLDETSGKLTEFLKLPSGGDNSYPGLVWHDGLLWVSYYSSHEGKTSIYLARVDVGEK